MMFFKSSADDERGFMGRKAESLRRCSLTHRALWLSSPSQHLHKQGRNRVFSTTCLCIQDRPVHSNPFSTQQKKIMVMFLSNCLRKVMLKKRFYHVEKNYIFKSNTLRAFEKLASLLRLLEFNWNETRPSHPLIETFLSAFSYQLPDEPVTSRCSLDLVCLSSHNVLILGFTGQSVGPRKKGWLLCGTWNWCTCQSTFTTLRWSIVNLCCLQ